MNKTRDQMIAFIYKEVADKTVNFGCVIQDKGDKSFYILIKFKVGSYIDVQSTNGEDGYFMSNIKTKRDFEKQFKVIGHPIMIGDILNIYNGQGTTYELVVKGLWRYLTKPIEFQSNECLKNIYNLISKQGQN